METSIISTVVLPAAIFLIMVSVGMTLTLDDFKRVATQPRQVLVGLLCQLFLLPLIGFGVASLFALEPIYAISIVLLAAAPGGSTSNVIVHAAEGDRALSVTLTALSNSVVWLTMPLLLNVAYNLYAGGGQVIDFPIVDTMVQVAGLTIVPVIVGMGIRRWKEDFAENSKNTTRTAAVVFLALVILALIYQNWATILSDGPRYAPAFIVLNLVALAVGYGVARVFGINHIQSSTISIETGLQNGTIAITIAISVLNNAELAVIPGLYSVWMLATGFGLAFLLARSQRGTEEAQQPASV